MAHDFLQNMIIAKLSQNKVVGIVHPYPFFSLFCEQLLVDKAELRHHCNQGFILQKIRIFHLCFLAHYRHFKLHLIPHVELFSENFHAYSVGENNEKIEIAVDKDSFYKGYDEGITLSSFTPVCDSQSNLILAQISNISLWHFFLQKQHCGLSKARFKQGLLIVNYKMIYSCITCKLFSFNLS